jgi:DNA-directed RNA polymerase alpha subunit
MGLKKLEERNNQIFAQRKHGLTYRELAKEFNLSGFRVSSICAQEQRRKDKRVVHDEVIASSKPELADLNPVLFRKVDELEWSVRTGNCLANDNIIYICDLVLQSAPDLLRIPNLGLKGIDEIKEVLATMGLHLTLKKMTKWGHRELITYYA